MILQEVDIVQVLVRMLFFFYKMIVFFLFFSFFVFVWVYLYRKRTILEIATTIEIKSLPSYSFCHVILFFLSLSLSLSPKHQQTGRALVKPAYELAQSNEDYERLAQARNRTTYDAASFCVEGPRRRLKRGPGWEGPATYADGALCCSCKDCCVVVSTLSNYF